MNVRNKNHKSALTIFFIFSSQKIIFQEIHTLMKILFLAFLFTFLYSFVFFFNAFFPSFFFPSLASLLFSSLLFYLLHFIFRFFPLFFLFFSSFRLFMNKIGHISLSQNSFKCTHQGLRLDLLVFDRFRQVEEGLEK